MNINPDPKQAFQTVVQEQRYWHEPATERPEWGVGGYHEYTAERMVQTTYGPWKLTSVDGKPLPKNQSAYDGLFYVGDGTPGTIEPAPSETTGSEQP